MGAATPEHIRQWGDEHGYTEQQQDEAVALYIKHQDEDGGNPFDSFGFPYLYRGVWVQGIVPPDPPTATIARRVRVGGTLYSVAYAGDCAGWELYASEGGTTGAPISQPMQTREQAEAALDAWVRWWT